MPELTLHLPEGTKKLAFSGEPILYDLLRDEPDAPDRPCGGSGKCGRCAVPARGALTPPPDAEGQALSCQTRVTGDAEVWLPRRRIMTQIETRTRQTAFPLSPRRGEYGAAVDIGTTTVVLQLLRLADREALATVSCENPQRVVAADVIGRIDAALKGQLPMLRRLVRHCVDELEREAFEQARLPGRLADVRVISGNTTMLYLFSGRSPHTLAAAPFLADCLFGFQEGRDLFPACAGAFVGGDITCAVLSSGMTKQSETALLIDVGTNGEIALWHEGVMRCLATAAGPAFEGGGISCGVGSVPGAVDRVRVEGREIRLHTLNGAPPIGLCGSGLIDLTSALLETERLDEAGFLEEDVPLGEGIALTQRDVRQVQLAKGAVAAGIRTLLKQAGISENQVRSFYIAGGFGSRLDLQNAARIGLIPASLIPKAVVLGNASLSGARQLLLSAPSWEDALRIARDAQCLNAAACPGFSDDFVDCMLF